MNNEDAKATIKQAILNGYTDTYKNPAQDMIESIYDAIMAPGVRWALLEELEDEIEDSIDEYVEEHRQDRLGGEE